MNESNTRSDGRLPGSSLPVGTLEQPSGSVESRAEIYDDYLSQPGTSNQAGQLKCDDISFKRRSGTSKGYHGYQYEMKVTMLCLFRGLSSKSDFWLASNIDGFGAFDDIVFRFKDQINKSKIVLIQAKHFDKPGPIQNITFEDLFIEGNDRRQQKNNFGLKKYFQSYLDVRKNTEFKDSDIISVIHTNVNLNLTGKKAGDKTLNMYLEKLEELDANISNIYKNHKGAYYKINKPTELTEYFSPNSSLEVEEFLLGLRFAVDQPNKYELDNIIKREMKNKYKIEAKEDVDSVFTSVYCKVEEWWGKQGKIRWLTKENNFFEEAIEHLYSRKPKEKFSNSCIPYIRNGDFVGRENLLNSMKDFLKSDSLVVCHGLGGVGKTQLALEFSLRHGDDYPGSVVWVDAGDKDKLVNDYIKFGRELNIIHPYDEAVPTEELASRVKHWLENPQHSGWLLICDNAQNYQDIASLLPKKEGKVLITSRYEFGWPGKPIPVGVFEPEESRQYFIKVLEKQQPGISDIDQLAETLGHLPLALAQAAAFMQKNNVMILRYLELYDKSKKALLSDKSLLNKFPAGSNIQPVYLTWDITIKTIKSESLLASDWLNICAYLNNYGIPDSLFEIFADNPQNNPNSDIFDSARGLLKNYSMLTSNQQGSSIHNVLQEVIRLKLKEEMKEGELLKKALGLFENRVDSNNVDHAMSVWNYANVNTGLVKEFTKLPYNIMCELNDKWRFKETYNFGKKVLELFNNTLPPDHPDTLRIHGLTANTLCDQGEYKEALQAHHELLNKREGILGFDHPSTLKTRCDIARALNKMGKFEEALKILQEVWPKQRKILEPNNVDVLATKNSIAAVLSNQGKYKEAYEIFNEIYKSKEVNFGPTHCETLETLNDIAQVLIHQGKYEEALQIIKKILVHGAESLEPNNPLIVTTQNNMIQILYKQGKYKEALKISEKVYRETENLLGAFHSETLTSHHFIGLILCSQGKHEDALQIFNDVYKKSIEVLGPDHCDTLDNNHSIAVVLREQGKYEEAVRIFREIYYAQKRTLGPGHHQTLNTLHNIAEVLSKQYKLDEALLLFKEAYDEMVEILGANHPCTLTSLNNMADVLSKQGKHDEALLLFKESYDKMVEILGADYPDTLIPLNNMADVLSKQGKCDKALRLYQKVIDEQAKILDADHPRILDVKLNIAMILHKQGKHDESLQVFQWVCDKREEALGHEHPDTLSAMDGMARVLLAQKKFEEALQILQKVFKAQKKEGILGPNHPDTLTTENDIICTLQMQRKYSLSLKISQEVFDRRKKVLGYDHPETVMANFFIANGILIQGEYNEALKTYQEVLEKQEKNLGSDHPHTLGTMKSIDGALKMQRKNWTLLHLAASYGSKEKVKQLLLNQMYNINAVTEDGFKPLHLAVKNNNEKTTSSLIEHFKNKHPEQLSSFLSSQANLKMTPLHIAVQNDCREIIEILLKNGAHYDVKNKQGKMPLDLAKPGVRNLLNYIGKLFKAVQDGKKDEVCSLIEGKSHDTLKIVLNARNSDKKTLAQVALASGQRDVARTIIQGLLLPE